MRFILHTTWVSPHLLPIARAIARCIGKQNVVYHYIEPPAPGHLTWKWDSLIDDSLCRRGSENDSDVQNCDVLLTGVRNIELFAKRMENNQKVYYMSERWFKPPFGILRLLHLNFFNMARDFVGLLEKDNLLYFLPIGIHAARDMARLCGLMHWDLRCLFRAPELEFDKRPGGRVYLAAKGAENAKMFCLDKMRMWGYFVERGERGMGNVSPERSERRRRLNAGWERSRERTLRVLWVGRLLKLKRVDTIIRAVGELSQTYASSPRLNTNDYQLTTTLDIYGSGPEELRLKKMATKYGDVIKFHPPVPIDEVRKLMREHDVYVLASNGYEGWGAVVSEALEEGMRVIGTYEAGSSITMLPETCLFHSGDWKTLKWILQSEIPQCGIGTWTAKEAACVITGTIRE